MRLGRRTMPASDGSPRGPPEPTPTLRRELRSAENNSRHRSRWGVLGPPPSAHPFSSRLRDFYAIRRRRLSAPLILLSDRTPSFFFFFFFFPFSVIFGRVARSRRLDVSLRAFHEDFVIGDTMRRHRNNDVHTDMSVR